MSKVGAGLSNGNNVVRFWKREGRLKLGVARREEERVREVVNSH